MDAQTSSKMDSMQTASCHPPPSVCLRLQYPNNLGCSVTKEMLQGLLEKLRNEPCYEMFQWQWTLSGRIIPSPPDTISSPAQQVSEGAEDYFCVTSPAVQSSCSPGWPHVVTTCDTPTIIAELYHNIKPGSLLPKVIKKIKGYLQECICASSKERIWYCQQLQLN